VSPSDVVARPGRNGSQPETCRVAYLRGATRKNPSEGFPNSTIVANAGPQYPTGAAWLELSESERLYWRFVHGSDSYQSPPRPHIETAAPGFLNPDYHDGRRYRVTPIQELEDGWRFTDEQEWLADFAAESDAADAKAPAPEEIFDFLVQGGWHIEKAGTNGRPVGRPIGKRKGITCHEMIRTRLRKYGLVDASLAESTAMLAGRPGPKVNGQAVKVQQLERIVWRCKQDGVNVSALAEMLEVKPARLYAAIRRCEQKLS
jgi:hypothetical protein